MEENKLPSEPSPVPRPKKSLKEKAVGLGQKFVQRIQIVPRLFTVFSNLFKPLTEKITGIFRKITTPLRALGSLVAKIIPKPLKEMVRKLFSALFNMLPEPARKILTKHSGKVILLIVLLLAGFGVKHFLLKPKAKIPLEKAVAQKEETKEAPVAVKGFKIGRFNFEDSLNVLGNIKGAMEFKLSFEVPGIVSSVNYREGERYEEGALLMSLRQDDILLRLKRAQAELKKAEAEVQIGEDKVREHEKLLGMGAIPQMTLDRVKLELEKGKYDAEAARLEMKANEAMLEKSNLYAPSAGMIGELNVEEGEAISPNTLLGTHIMTEYVFAEFGVVERDVNKIALGQKAKVFVDAYPDKTFEGVIENISPVVTGTSRTATAKVRLENPERLLLPGMFARVRILLYSKKNTLVIPTDAMQGEEGQQFVYVINKEKGVVEKRAVTIGYKRPDYAQVDAGISEGELVAVSGFEKLGDGKAIRLVETQEAEL